MAVCCLLLSIIGFVFTTLVIFIFGVRPFEACLDYKVLYRSNETVAKHTLNEGHLFVVLADKLNNKGKTDISEDIWLGCFFALFVCLFDSTDTHVGMITLNVNLFSKTNS